MSMSTSVLRSPHAPCVGLSLVAGLALCLGPLGCGPKAASPAPGSSAVSKPDLSKDGSNSSGPWQYAVSISNKGTKSEGIHGKLLYNGHEAIEPGHVNDFYNTPWGPLYWVGRPSVLFGGHGWMPSPLPSQAVGQALADPSTWASTTFAVQVKVLSPEELATPDRMETDTEVLSCLKPFDLKAAHVQRGWFVPTGQWITLHDTKRWGTLTLRMAKPDAHCPVAVELQSTSGMTVEMAGLRNTLESLIPSATVRSAAVALPPQAGAMRASKVTLCPPIGDPLELLLVCRVQVSKGL